MAAWVVIMAGGGGTRLWPLSRRSLPKQFLPLLAGGETLLQAALGRAAALATPDRTLIVTQAEQAETIRRALPTFAAENIVVEPIGRNTAACIGLAALHVGRQDPGAVMAVLPADQSVVDPKTFHAVARKALGLAEQGEVVTLGIRPTRPETGFGYIECGAPTRAPEARTVVRFVEKPNHATAERYLASDRYLWNSGMFFFSAARIRAEIAKHAPKLDEILRCIEADPAKLGELYPRAPSVSIDVAVMEKLGGRMVVLPAEIGWSDVGSFASLPEVRPPDGSGNSVIGDAMAIDARGNVLVGSPGTLVAAIGVDDLVIVATRDAVLVVPKERAQEVRRVVEALESSRRDQHL